ncbi:MAG TPA: penicillin-binding protein 2 [Verrucomicrobiae bacterium]|nr:penicillin-binding protein 2 [Verrucomicrobiae bacterium]
MIRPAQYRRLAAMALLLAIAFAGLGYRLVDLHVFRHEELVGEASVRQRREIRAPRRGDILDTRGNQLATSIFVKTVFADPSLIGTNQAIVARALAPVLKMDPAELARKLKARTWKDEQSRERTVRFEILKRKVSLDEWDRICGAMTNLSFGTDEKKLTKTERAFYRNLRLSAISAVPADDQLRVYPHGTLAAHVLGYTGTREDKVDGLPVTELVGRDGIEAWYNSVLNGVVGWRETEMDSGRRELAMYRGEDIAPRPGLNVVLTLDVHVQNIVESELAAAMEKHAPVSITAVVVHPKTGKIVAMATLPGFNPNRIGSDIPMAHLRNRAITDIAEPGSTFKIVVVSGALTDGVVSLSDLFFCENGLFRYAGLPLRDDHHGYGDLTVEQIIAKSSNIGAAKIGIRMGKPRLYHHMRSFGFGEKTGITLPGEVNGTVHPLNKWQKPSISRIPMGHEVATTPLQMVMAMSAIANGGKLMRPMLVERLVDGTGRDVMRYEPQVVRQVISESASRFMVQALKRAVATNGTGVKARLEHYTVAGKTGTAQKLPYTSGKYFSSFIGFFPADDPELCISVVLDDPDRRLGGYYGGETAAPIFRKIAERVAVQLNIPPDQPPADDLAPSPLETFTKSTPRQALTEGSSQRDF